MSASDMGADFLWIEGRENKSFAFVYESGEAGKFKIKSTYKGWMA